MRRKKRIQLNSLHSPEQRNEPLKIRLSAKQESVFNTHTTNCQEATSGSWGNKVTACKEIIFQFQEKGPSGTEHLATINLLYSHSSATCKEWINYNDNNSCQFKYRGTQLKKYFAAYLAGRFSYMVSHINGWWQEPKNNSWVLLCCTVVNPAHLHYCHPIKPALCHSLCK